MQELRERSASQPDQQRFARLGMKEQERHHAAGVVERERVRIVEPHRALHRLSADVQRAHAASLGDDELGAAAQARVANPH